MFLQRVGIENYQGVEFEQISDQHCGDMDKSAHRAMAHLHSQQHSIGHLHCSNSRPSPVYVINKTSELLNRMCTMSSKLIMTITFVNN